MLHLYSLSLHAAHRYTADVVAKLVSECERTQTQVAELVAQLVASVNGSDEIHGKYKFSNFLLNLLSNMWLV